MLQNEKRSLESKFEMKDLGESHYIIKRDRSRKRILLHQSKYLMQLLEKFGVKDCRQVATPRDQNVKRLPYEEALEKAKYQAFIHSITYAATGTRPDLAQGSLSQFCSNPGKDHWIAAKRTLRCIKGSLNYGIMYDGSKQRDVKHIGYTDADWGTNSNDRQSQSGYTFLLCGGIVNWMSNN